MDDLTLLRIRLTRVTNEDGSTRVTAELLHDGTVLSSDHVTIPPVVRHTTVVQPCPGCGSYEGLP